MEDSGVRPAHYRPRRPLSIAMGIVLLFVTLAWSKPVQGQHYQIIHTFTDGQDSANPQGSLVMDRQGRLYGTASQGGPSGCGGVFRMSNNGSGWIFTSLYNFKGSNDGCITFTGVTIGLDGGLYGVTYYGGTGGCDGNGCGTVYRLQPGVSFCRSVSCSWTETVLYRFQGGDDGGLPSGNLIFDRQGNIYGTTSFGGPGGAGTVFELTPSTGGWTKTILYSFTGAPDGAGVNAGVVFDQFGDLYGTTVNGGANNAGTIYELTPSSSGWIKNTLYSFYNTGDGELPFAGLVLNGVNYPTLYGATAAGGSAGGGTVFELTPSLGNWTYNVLYSLVKAGNLTTTGPQAALTMDGSGNLYGTAFEDGAHGWGSVFKLTLSNGNWSYSSLHDFNYSDGADLDTSVLLDQQGNLYGTASDGGTTDYGVVFQITP